jgi:23S rRNA (adenine2503-C2)-methyltransferase
MPETRDLLGLTWSAFTDLAARQGVSAPEALAIYRRCFRLGEQPPPWVGFDVGPVVRQVREQETVKFLQAVDGHLESESVLIPGTGSSGRQRHTLCVSSQIGCALGCRFCETAQMGLMRSLTAAQIVGQWHAARFDLGRSVRNVVFMGMGEPLDNLDSVIGAIRVLSDDNGPAIAPARITVSTVGVARGIERLSALAAEAGYGKLRLAVSINAPDDDLRSELMPINRAVPLADLRAAMDRWCSRPGARILAEYVLIPGVNDDLDLAEALCRYLRGLPCVVNVIPYNPRRGSPWPAPAAHEVNRFVERIAALGQPVRRRQTHGRAVMAACGQLGSEGIRGGRGTKARGHGGAAGP